MAGTDSPWHWKDFGVAGLLALSVAGWSLDRSSALHPVLYQYAAAGVVTSDTWFDADIPAAVCQATDRLAVQHQATARHPLISTARYLPAAALGSLWPAPVITTMRRATAVWAALWTLALYLLLRSIGCPLVDAVAFTALGAVSGVGLFWTVVPESHLMGSITVMLPMCLLGTPARRARLGDVLLTLASAVSMSVALTNCVSGIGVALAVRGWRHAAQIFVNSLMLVALLWGVQAMWFPTARFFFAGGGLDTVVNQMDAHTPLEAVVEVLEVPRNFLFHGIVVPTVTIDGAPGTSRQLIVQGQWPGSSGLVGAVATALWLGLLAYGARRLFREPEMRSLRLALLATLAAQLGLHLIVGEETFLFSPYFSPLLIVVAAFGALGPHRAVVRALAVVLVLAAGVNNAQQFERAAQMVNEIGGDLAARGAVFHAEVDRCR